MKVKKFIASNMPDAMKSIRKELGVEAIILHSREVETGGFLGFFTKRAIEVTAAVDPGSTKNNQKPSLDENKIAHQSQDTDKASNHNQTLKELMSKIDELTHTVDTMSTNRKPSIGNIPVVIEAVIKNLISQEVTSEITEQITEELLNKWYRLENKEEINNATSLVSNWVTTILSDLLKDVPISIPEFDSKIITLVGPTGVGKTTTLAKLAAVASLQHKKKVAFITTDTYRIAAIDQLKTYADILSVPIKIAYTVSDFKQSLEEFEEYDLILVDTAGRNFLKKFYVDELAKVIDFNRDMKTYLVLSLTGKYSDMQSTYHHFQSLPIRQVIFTKKDETSTYGNILNMVVENKLGVAYITTGQNVPDDIQPATHDELIKLFTGEYSHE
jgi:flagellar biosynthesis protein FlhF